MASNTQEVMMSPKVKKFRIQNKKIILGIKAEVANAKLSHAINGPQLVIIMTGTSCKIIWRNVKNPFRNLLFHHMQPHSLFKVQKWCKLDKISKLSQLGKLEKITLFSKK